MTIILATLVDLLFPMIYAKIQPQGILGFEEEDFWRFFPYKCIGKQTWPCRKKVKCQYTTFILAILVDLLSPMTYAKIQPQASSVLEKKIFKGFYHIWAWRPSWSMDRDHFSNFSFPQPKEAPHEIWAKLAQGLQRRSRLKMLTDWCTDRRTDARTDGRIDDGQKVITIAHPEHSSGELKIQKRHKIRKPTFRQVHPAKTYIRLHTGAVLSDAIQMHKEAKLTLP